MSWGLSDRLTAAGSHGHDVVFLDGESPNSVSWTLLHDRARRTAAVLQSRGLEPGGRVALLGSTSPSLLTTIQACWLAGAAVIVLPLQTRLEPVEEFARRSRERVALADASLTICDPELVEVADPSHAERTMVFTDVDALAEGTSADAFDDPGSDPERTAILQFTSGSTADPKGVVIPERCLLANLDAIADRSPVVPGDDVMVSWLPLYHDMGLVYAAAQAMTTGTQFILAPPARFISSPGSWMEWMEEFGGTWTVGPNFSLTIGARLLAWAPKLDLSQCGRWGSGSEPVDPTVMDAFADAGVAHSLDPRAIHAGYGMAEATVAISIPAPGTGFISDIVDGRILEHEGRAEPRDPDASSARRMARCGPPLRGIDLRITDPDTGATLDDRSVGEIEVRGGSIVPGYYQRPDATAAAFREGGWLRTGDQGYLADGDVVVCGRIKDMIIVGGRNVFPEDLERPVQTVEGVRAGNVIAFGVDGGRKGESVVVVAELKGGDPGVVRDAIARVVGEACGLRPDDIVLLAPGALPKTSSGKLRRTACRAMYQASELSRL